MPPTYVITVGALQASIDAWSEARCTCCARIGMIFPQVIFNVEQCVEELAFNALEAGAHHVEICAAYLNGRLSLKIDDGLGCLRCNAHWS
eukprot:NODE_10214_length_448_cov_1.378446_g9110_i0.p1 GENE.NODE_10214_length_448_cov_1.378446_g9110_i0~~NODE_10214_length_448_cov_1.378446_g9110_i0.p1  ORF type:complete len:90 (-),score=2.36 NODE_10214_length_448_cov_1.378446_g9110_i0:140-409(-)